MIWLDEGGQQRDLCLIAPPAELDHSVEHLWIHRELPKESWRVVPDLSAHVIFSIVDCPTGLSASCRVVGARSRFSDVNMKGRVLTIGARLRPGALPHLLRDAVPQLTDRSVGLDCIVGQPGLKLVEQMAEIGPHEAFRLFATFLQERLNAARPSIPSDVIGSIPSVTGLAQALSLSRRGVYHKIVTSVGLPPKLALRIQRLHKALLLLNTRAPLADVAARVGYSDQAHFTREATWLLGQPPLAWRRRSCSFLQDTNVRARNNGSRYAPASLDCHRGTRHFGP